jgi:hypothetical protein
MSSDFSSDELSESLVISYLNSFRIYRAVLLLLWLVQIALIPFSVLTSFSFSSPFIKRSFLAEAVLLNFLNSSLSAFLIFRLFKS